MNSFQSALLWLDGKKAVLSQLLSAINVYLMATGVIDNLLGALIQTVIIALTTGAVAITNNAANDVALSNTFGSAVRQKRQSLIK